MLPWDMRNPKWHRDEIILALELYFSPDRGPIDRRNPRIIQLSALLNTLPLISDRPDAERFRNPDGVSFKLSNFLALDKQYAGKGMTHGSKLDKKLFEEYSNNQPLLRYVAAEVKHIVEDPELRQAIYKVEDDEQTQEDSVIEGQILYKLHKVRERAPKIIKAKKDQAMEKYGKLICEACVFVFEETYGTLGTGFIECHHRTPLAQFKAEKKTRLEDLALVCSNCHRMLHKQIDTLSVEDLREIIKNSRQFKIP
jgi:5-methylcytosine-specific restriction protein A